MRTGWHSISFEETFSDESAGNIKTPQSEFLSHGHFPVIDQGKGLIAGYVNDETRLCRAPLPVIVFGDHTRCIKFVDFPFCMGADGTKVLRPRVEAHAKYLYHYLRQLRLPDAGYDRHFKYLKRTEVLLPPLDEQRRIATILDQVEALWTKRRQALAKLETLTQSLFLELFGNSGNPHQWPTAGLGKFFNFTTGKLDSNAAVPHGAYPFFTCSRDDLRIDHYAFDCEALLLAGNNATADYSVKHYKGKFNAYQRTYVITLKSKEHSYAYAKVVLERKLAEMKRFSKGSNTKYLTLSILKDIQVQIPHSALQQEFEHQAAVLARLKETQRASLLKLDALFASLQHHAFRGEL